MPWGFENDRSIYIQLVEQIQNRIATGDYPPGSRLPSVRDLAQEAAVNPNTMQRALAELERMDLVHSQRTSGRFVTEDEGRIQSMKRETARQAVRSFLGQMEDLGFERDEIAALIREEQGKNVIADLNRSEQKENVIADRSRDGRENIAVANRSRDEQEGNEYEQ